MYSLKNDKKQKQLCKSSHVRRTLYVCLYIFTTYVCLYSQLRTYCGTSQVWLHFQLLAKSKFIYLMFGQHNFPYLCLSPSLCQCQCECLCLYAYMPMPLESQIRDEHWNKLAERFVVSTFNSFRTVLQGFARQRRHKKTM